MLSCYHHWLSDYFRFIRPNRTWGWTTTTRGEEDYLELEEEEEEEDGLLDDDKDMVSHNEVTLDHDEVTLDIDMDEVQSVPSTTLYIMDELKLGSEWRQHQQRHGWIGIGVNDDSVNIVMDELELELNDDSNKIEHWGSREMSKKK